MTMPPPIPTSPERTPANIPKLRLPSNDFTRTSVALSKTIRLHFANQSCRPAEAGRLRNENFRLPSGLKTLLALACHNFQYLSFPLLQYSALPVQCSRIKGCDGGTF